MSALVETMFSVREVPWHREGLVLAEYPGSWAEARKPAGLEWDPISEPVYALSGVNAAGQPVYVAEEGWKRIARSDTGATLSLSQDSYTLIDNTEMGGIIEAVLEQGNVKYETAGSLDGGKAVWCLVRLDEEIQLKGDASTTTLPYMAVTNRHDGRGKCALRATSIRIVCMNTFNAAELEGQRTGAEFSFTHTSKWRDRIAEAREAVTGARREFAAYKALAEQLLGIRVTDKQREQFIQIFIPMPPAGVVTDRVAANVEQARGSLRTIFESTTTFSVKNTAYGLVQAAGEYLDHIRTAKTWESKLGRTLIRPEPLKARALGMVREIVKAG